MLVRSQCQESLLAPSRGTLHNGCSSLKRAEGVYDSIACGTRFAGARGLGARRYYLDERSKVEIAEELGVSRFKIARLLEVARDSGLVRIESVTQV